MNKVYVVIHKDNKGKLDVETFKDKEVAIATVMDIVYGKGWESQASDQKQEKYGKIQTDLDALWYGDEVIDDSGSWVLKESEVQED